MSRITANGHTFAEAIADAMTKVIARTSSPASDASLVIPLRARESDLTTLAEALLGELLAEIGDGARIGSVRIDGFMRRDGDWICWGYAFAADERGPAPPSAPSLRDVVVDENEGRIEMRFNLNKPNSTPVDFGTS
jgi:hypothetical protein